MGTIISDRSHSATFNLNFMLRQVTVILTGFIPPFRPLSRLQKILP
jgi:hypothetical protein